MLAVQEGHRGIVELLGLHGPPLLHRSLAAIRAGCLPTDNARPLRLSPLFACQVDTCVCVC